MRDFFSPTLSIPVQIKRHFYFYLIGFRLGQPSVCLRARLRRHVSAATRNFIFIFDNEQYRTRFILPDNSAKLNFEN